MATQTLPRKRYLRTRATTQPKTQSQQTSTKSTPGSWIKSKILPWFAPWFQPHRCYDPEESFIPFPKVTFLIDEPIRLECQICHQANCQISQVLDQRRTSSVTEDIARPGLDPKFLRTVPQSNIDDTSRIEVSTSCTRVSSGKTALLSNSGDGRWAHHVFKEGRV
ncbi:unnamed protein product [Fusarium venenatum]|uniref:Uncharacterized protein n=1 Tax=Fusarium venenatum TaxID=56646 RepID=A0A2L2TJ91_9HYPO|nr:uncharacterized protein FVRRES_13098 [Fusarium venenatum]CEI40407.1 unnamed protein product [Fusarium venenatum]